METIAAILERAQQRAREMDLPYGGALLPGEALDLLQEAPEQNWWTCVREPNGIG